METSVDDVGTSCGGVDYYWNGPGCDRTLLDVYSSDGSLAAKDAMEAFEGTRVADRTLVTDDGVANCDQFGADSGDQPGAFGKNRSGRKAYHIDGLGSSGLLRHCEPDGYHGFANGQF